MDYISLGRTGLRVSVAGLGTGGHSKLGQRQGASVATSINVIHEALDLGINVIDTSFTGGMESIVGEALSGRRDSVVVATKVHPSTKLVNVVDAPTLRNRVEDALGRLQTDRIDILYLHGVDPREYDYCAAELLPEMEKLRDRGLVRFVGVTESWTHAVDTEHAMLSRAINDDYWDVVMLGFNILNQTARTSVLEPAMAKGVGTFAMYVVRDLLSRPDLLRSAIRNAIDDGALNIADIDADDPLGFLVHDGGASTIIDAAYRFARHEPGIQVVLTGTGNVEHLRANVTSITREPLPDADQARLRSLFDGIAYFSGNA